MRDANLGIRRAQIVESTQFHEPRGESTVRMSNRHIMTTGLFCALTFVATYLVFRPAQVGPELPPAAPAIQPPDARIDHEETPATEALNEECQALQVELESLRSELARMQVEMSELERAAVQGILTTMIDRLAEKNAVAADAQEVVVNATRRANLRSGLFGGIYDWMLLLHDASRLGDAGIEGLTEFAQDPNKSSDDRDLALEMLSFLPAKASLDFLMRPHPDLDYDGFTDLSDGSILAHLERLPTGDIAEYIPEIREHSAAALAGGCSSRDAVGPVVVLALTHGDADSLRILDQLYNNDAQITEVITSASWIGTPEALQYVEEIARTHPSDSVRSRAQQLLGAE